MHAWHPAYKAPHTKHKNCSPIHISYKELQLYKDINFSVITFCITYNVQLNLCFKLKSDWFCLSAMW